MNKYKYGTFLLFIITSVFSFVSCEKDRSLDKDSVNEWIYSIMEKNYLWYDELPQLSNVNNNLSPDVFFESLLSDKDGKDGYHYSSIEEDISTKSGSISTTHGFYPRYIIFRNNPTKVYMRVLYITPGSPAEEAGLKRGDWVSHYNGTELTASNYEDFHSYKGSMTLNVGKFENGVFVKTQDVELKSAVSMEINPIYADTTFLINNRKISYLMYNSFVSGPVDNTDKTYDNQLRSVFSKFANANPDEFILDLRYNPGGLITCARLLATMLAPDEALGKTFCKLIYNDKLSSDTEFKLDKSVIENGKNINMKSLFIITSTSTASSSELIINGLRPYMNVVLVGDSTVGKNVGSNEFSDKSNHSWVLHPIVCLVENAEGFSDYSDGFAPDFQVDEIDYYGSWKELGDTEEYMLRNVLHIIENGSLPTGFRSSSSRAIKTLKAPDQRAKGIIIQ